MNIKTTNVRFNLEKPNQKKAWDYLRSMDKNRFRSYSQVICQALIEYFDRYYKLQRDPYLESRQREEQFVKEIVDAVSCELQKMLPVFLAGCMVSASPLVSSENTRKGSEDEKLTDIDWGFLGE